MPQDSPHSLTDRMTTDSACSVERESLPDAQRLHSLLEPFLDRLRRGESPSISEYEKANPELEEEIPELFPAMRLMEEVYTRSFSPREEEQDQDIVDDTLGGVPARLAQGRRPPSEAERELQIVEDVLDEKHFCLASALSSLALLLEATDRLSQAEVLMRRALHLVEQSSGANHPEVAICLSTLAQLLQDTERPSEAESLMQRALRIVEQSYGHCHPKVATCLSDLAHLLQDTNRRPEAEPLYRRALVINEQSYGTNHVDVAVDLNNLAQLLHDMNQLSEAEPLYRRALAIDEQYYGTEHDEVAVDLNNLAALLKDKNRLPEAEPLYRRALAIDEQSYGAEHPHVALDLNRLATLLKDTGRLTEAEQLMRRHLEILLKATAATGHRPAHLQAPLDAYADILQAMGWNPTRIHQTLSEILGEHGLVLPHSGGDDLDENIGPEATTENLTERILSVLKSLRAFGDFYLAPDIPESKARNACRKCSLAANTRILALIDLTVFGSAKDCWLFDEEGIHYHNMGDYQRVYYNELPDLNVPEKKLGSIAFDANRKFSLLGSDVPKGEAITMLRELRELLKRALTAREAAQDS